MVIMSNCIISLWERHLSLPMKKNPVPAGKVDGKMNYVGSAFLIHFSIGIIFGPVKRIQCRKNSAWHNGMVCHVISQCLAYFRYDKHSTVLNLVHPRHWLQLEFL